VPRQKTDGNSLGELGVGKRDNVGYRRRAPSGACGSSRSWPQKEWLSEQILATTVAIGAEVIVLWSHPRNLHLLKAMTKTSLHIRKNALGRARKTVIEGFVPEKLFAAK